MGGWPTCGGGDLIRGGPRGSGRELCYIYARASNNTWAPPTDTILSTKRRPIQRNPAYDQQSSLMVRPRVYSFGSPADSPSWPARKSRARKSQGSLLMDLWTDKLNSQTVAIRCPRIGDLDVMERLARPTALRNTRRRCMATESHVPLQY